MVTGMRLILEGCQKLAVGRRQSHHRSTVHGDLHPEGMPDATNLAPLSGCKRNFLHQPVVALRLPPANFLNRFTVNRKERHYHKPLTWFHPFHTRAQNLSLNQKIYPLRGLGLRASSLSHGSASAALWSLRS